MHTRMYMERAPNSPDPREKTVLMICSTNLKKNKGGNSK